VDQKRFEEIRRFAIEKEIRSFDFYTRASQMANYSGSKDLFFDLAKQEEGHRKLLEGFSVEKIEAAEIKPIPDLKISDYLIEVPWRPDLDYAGILRVAMKMEEHALRLYEDLAKSSEEGDVKKLFTFLAEQEAKHKLKVEKTYDDEILK
jgi:rubrerythrin